MLERILFCDAQKLTETQTQVPARAARSLAARPAAPESERQGRAGVTDSAVSLLRTTARHVAVTAWPGPPVSPAATLCLAARPRRVGPGREARGRGASRCDRTVACGWGSPTAKRVLIVQGRGR